MPLTIGHLIAEVITEPEGHSPADTGAPGADVPELRQPVRVEIAALLRQELRTRAEGFDD